MVDGWENAFRAQLSAAPLKQRELTSARELSEAFRAQLSAAPLKHSICCQCSLPSRAFRAQLSAAPLKRTYGKTTMRPDKRPSALN